MSEEWTARYTRHGQPGQEECDSLSEAIGLLATQWDMGNLAEIDILAPDGTVALAGDELHRAMMNRIGA